MSVNAPRKIAVVTGSRADYGLLLPVMRALRDAAQFKLQVIVTGMHLAPAFGNTWQVIEQDGFSIDAKVASLVEGDDAPAVTKSIGQGVSGCADTLQKLQPDLLLVLGDRYEIFAAVQAALIACVPVAHLAGGDLTEGAYDDALRHSMTKMAHLHFTTHAAATRRVRQMGENPEHIHTVGSPALDLLNSMTLLDRSALEQELDIKLRARNLLITFHPVTLEPLSSTQQFEELLAALQTFDAATGLFLTYPNADNGGRALTRMLENFVAQRDHAAAFPSLGQLRYWSLLAQVSAVVGNSSSGLYEAPSFKVPTVNIGSRQSGREKAASVIDCEPQRAAITQAIKHALTLDCARVVNPYGDGRSAARIVAALSDISDFRTLLKKRFHVVEAPRA